MNTQCDGVQRTAVPLELPPSVLLQWSSCMLHLPPLPGLSQRRAMGPPCIAFPLWPNQFASHTNTCAAGSLSPTLMGSWMDAMMKPSKSYDSKAEMHCCWEPQPHLDGLVDCHEDGRRGCHACQVPKHTRVQRLAAARLEQRADAAAVRHGLQAGLDCVCGRAAWGWQGEEHNQARA